VLTDLENEQNSLPSKCHKSDPKSNLWMQCDKCKYTTHYNAFMIHHIRQHVKKKNVACDYCGEEVQSGTSCAKQCSAKRSGAEGKQTKHTAKKVRKYFAAEGGEAAHNEGSDTAESETVELITAEINEFRAPERGADSPDVVISTVQPAGGDRAAEPGVAAVIVDQSQQNGGSVGLTKADDVTIEVSQHAEGNVAPTAICVMEVSEDSSAEQPTLLTVQKMEQEGSAVYVQVVEVGKAEEAEEAEDPRSMTKQVLTVSEDGTVEMVEVMWDDMVSSEQDIRFG
jgi:hypothetical protein